MPDSRFFSRESLNQRLNDISLRSPGPIGVMVDLGDDALGGEQDLFVTWAHKEAVQDAAEFFSCSIALSWHDRCVSSA